MCQFKSCIILKDRVFVPDYDGHSAMLEELNIADTLENASRLFIRAEISPANGDVFSDVMGWKFRVDQDIVPDWFVPDIDAQRAKAAVAEWMQGHTIAEGEREVRDGVWYARDSATVTAHGSATVTALDRATVRAWDRAMVTAHDRATVRAYGSATVRAYGSATVTAYDSATVTAHGSATVTAWDRAMVRAHGSATVAAWDRAMVVARYRAMVRAHGSATVTAWDSATVRADDRAMVRAYGSATVIIPRYSRNNFAHVDVWDNAVVVEHNTHDIKSGVELTIKG